MAHNPSINISTVSSYSDRGSIVYDDPMNKNFLYGEITVRFLNQIEFSTPKQTVLDIGCGTGFGFDVLYEKFRDLELKGIGVEPADGMLRLAIDKFGSEPMFEFHVGSFENIPLEDNSVDRIISTLALHWVKDLSVAAREMHRVLKPGGRADIFMIARDDGANFKKAIVAAQQMHLTFSQIMRTAGLVQRVRPKDIEKHFAVFSESGEYKIEAVEHRDIVYGTFDEHMKWWKARSSPVIAEVKDKEKFILDLEAELEKISTDRGIPFDTAYLFITVKG